MKKYRRVFAESEFVQQVLLVRKLTVVSVFG